MQRGKKKTVAKPTIHTIGHSNRPLREFIELLDAHGIREIVDVRTVPKSRHNPQFNETRLASSLKKHGMRYERLEALGGFRHSRKDSKNTGWRNLSFSGYADYMGTDGFAKGLAKLESIARKRRVAIMCAEAVPWRCHRSLIADALVARGIPVAEIASPTRLQPHKLTPFAHVEGGAVTYPPSAATA